MKYTHNQKQDFAGLFNFRGYEKPIETCGSLTYDSNGFTINCSSVLTRLIQEAGRYCEHYASDLFLDWKQIDKEIEEGTIDTRTALFGFRESGVDHTDFVMSRASERQCLCTESARQRRIRLELFSKNAGKRIRVLSPDVMCLFRHYLPV